jgi:hypothetical protein
LFSNSRSKQHRKYRYFFASEAQTHNIYDVFVSGSKTPSKNTGICAVFNMLQEVIFPCKSHKTRFGSDFSFFLGVSDGV